MGIYWEIPFFETKATQESKNRYIWKSPNYGTYTFNKEPKAEFIYAKMRAERNALAIQT